MPQLRMVFDRAESPLPEREEPAGFTIRPMVPEDLEKYYRLRESVEWTRWEPEQLAQYRKTLIPGGLWVAVENTTGFLAASAAAERSTNPDYPDRGVLGWVMTHPEYRGHHLGRSVSIAAMHTLAGAGFRQFVLLTDDFRIPAVHTYLALGWQPWLYLPEMEDRWRALAETLHRSFEALKCMEKLNA